MTTTKAKSTNVCGIACDTGRMPRDQKMWNAVFTAFFVLLFAFFFWVLTSGLEEFKWLYFISTFDILVISLASFRLSRFIMHDKITIFVREWFLDVREGGNLVKPAGGVRRTVAELIECHWCTGLWAALFVSVLYFAANVGEFFVILLAVAAIGSFLQNLSHMIARIGN